MKIITLIALINEGLSTREIATTTNCSQTTVRYWLKKYNLNTNPKLGPKNPTSQPPKCAKCGETDPDKFYGKKKGYCGKCHNQITTKRGQDNKNKIVEFLGGKCIHCGYNEFNCALDLHHLDPSKKDPNFKSKRGWSWERIEKEISGCVLLCRNCHAALHNKLITIRG